MKHVVPKLALIVFLVSTAPMCAWAAGEAVVSGIVRDVHGTPQLGALVELLGPDASVVARAFTDEHGRYSLVAGLPGSYQLRASAAFLLPAVRGNLHLHSGVRAVADLTMTAIFEAGLLLPAEARHTSEPSDDWRWTLRSTANRPLLRWVGEDVSDSSGEVSSSEAHHRQAVSEGQLSFMSGDGTFGNGGTHQLLRLDRASLDGEASVLKANLGDGSMSGTGASFTVAAGLERKRTFGGDTRVFVSFASHPELQTGAGSGLAVLRTATAEQIALGDMITVDAGTLFTAERLLGERFNSAPYIRVALKPSTDLAVEYRFAADRNLQRAEDLDQTVRPEQELSDAQGHPILKNASHQEIALTAGHDSDVLTVAVYRDAVPVEGLGANGVIPAEDLPGLPILADPTTGTFRLAVRGYRADGALVSWSRVISPVFSVNLEGQVGGALALDGGPVTTADLEESVHSRRTAALSCSGNLHVKRTGTAVDLRYRWQPVRTLTQVDSFDASPGDAYMSVVFKQRLWAGRRVKRVNAVIEATNLLAQGYEPLLGPDGRTLFLAQVPRAVQGGLAFSF